MKITVEGTKKEIELIRNRINDLCVFDDEVCSLYESCIECEKKQGLIKEFIIK